MASRVTVGKFGLPSIRQPRNKKKRRPIKSSEIETKLDADSAAASATALQPEPGQKENSKEEPPKVIRPTKEEESPKIIPSSESSEMPGIIADEPLVLSNYVDTNDSKEVEQPSEKASNRPSMLPTAPTTCATVEAGHDEGRIRDSRDTLVLGVSDEKTAKQRSKSMKRERSKAAKAAKGPATKDNPGSKTPIPTDVTELDYVAKDAVFDADNGVGDDALDESVDVGKESSGEETTSTEARFELSTSVVALERNLDAVLPSLPVDPLSRETTQDSDEIDGVEVESATEVVCERSVTPLGDYDLTEENKMKDSFTGDDSGFLTPMKRDLSEQSEERDTTESNVRLKLVTLFPSNPNTYSTSEQNIKDTASSAKMPEALREVAPLEGTEALSLTSAPSLVTLATSIFTMTPSDGTTEITKSEDTSPPSAGSSSSAFLPFEEAQMPSLEPCVKLFDAPTVTYFETSAPSVENGTTPAEEAVSDFVTAPTDDDHIVTHVDTPVTDVDTPVTDVDTPVTDVDTPVTDVDTPVTYATEVAPISDELNTHADSAVAARGEEPVAAPAGVQSTTTPTVSATLTSVLTEAAHISASVTATASPKTANTISTMIPSSEPLVMEDIVSTVSTIESLTSTNGPNIIHSFPDAPSDGLLLHSAEEADEGVDHADDEDRNGKLHRIAKAALMTSQDFYKRKANGAEMRKEGTHFYDYLHPTMLQKGVSQYLLDPCFTDVVLVVPVHSSSSSSSTSPPPVVRIPAHKIILSVKCRIFRNMFLQNPEQKEFYLANIKDPHILFLLLSYIYGGKADFRWESCKPLYAAAAAFDLNSLLKACQRFLVENLVPENCLMAMRLGAEHEDDELEGRSRSFALKKFSSVCQASEFLRLSPDEIESLIQDENVNVESEERLYSAAIRWLEHDLENRRQHAYSVLHWVRFPMLHRDFILNVVDECEIMRSDMRCRGLLREAKLYLSPGNRINISAARVNPRPSTGYENVFLLLSPKVKLEDSIDYGVGFTTGMSQYRGLEGVKEGCISELWAYHPRLSAFRQLSSIPWPDYVRRRNGDWDVEVKRKKIAQQTWRLMEGAQLTGYGNDVFVVGGFDSNMTFRYHSELDTWSECAPMRRMMQFFTLATVGDAIYMIGGVHSGETTPVTTIDKYDISLNKWSHVGDLIWPVDSPACAVKQGFRGSDESLIFIVGGSTLTPEGDEFPACSHVQVFNVNTRTTLLATPLPIPSPDVQAINVEKKIYVITGKSLFVMEEEDEDEDEVVKADECSVISTHDDVEATEVKALNGFELVDEASSINGIVNNSGASKNKSANGSETSYGVDTYKGSAATNGAAVINGVAATNGEATAYSEDTVVKSQKESLKEAVIQLGVTGVGEEPPPCPIRSSSPISPPIGYTFRWVRLPPIPSLTGASTHMTTVCSNLSNIYLFGGFFHKRVIIFDTLANRWSGYEGANDQFRGINPAGSACIVAPTKVVNLDKCRTYDNGRVKVIPKTPRPIV